MVLIFKYRRRKKLKLTLLFYNKRSWVNKCCFCHFILKVFDVDGGCCYWVGKCDYCRLIVNGLWCDIFPSKEKNIFFCHLQHCTACCRFDINAELRGTLHRSSGVSIINGAQSCFSINWPLGRLSP